MPSSFSKLTATTHLYPCALMQNWFLGGLELVVQWLSQVQHWLGWARQMKLISGTFTTLITLASSQSGPPYLYASCSGLLCCPFIMQNPGLGIWAELPFPRQHLTFWRKRYSFGRSKPGVGPGRVEHFNLLPDYLLNRSLWILPLHCTL